MTEETLDLQICETERMVRETYRAIMDKVKADEDLNHEVIDENLTGSMLTYLRVMKDTWHLLPDA